jgi:hypothetical protein
MAGTTWVVYSNASTWDDAFRQAPAGEEAYASVLAAAARVGV